MKKNWGSYPAPLTYDFLVLLNDDAVGRQNCEVFLHLCEHHGLFGFVLEFETAFRFRLFAEGGVDFFLACEFWGGVGELCFERLVCVGEAFVLFAECPVDFFEASEFVGVFLQLLLKRLVCFGFGFNLLAEVGVLDSGAVEFLLTVGDLVVALGFGGSVALFRLQFGDALLLCLGDVGEFSDDFSEGLLFGDCDGDGDGFFGDFGVDGGGGATYLDGLHLLQLAFLGLGLGGDGDFGDDGGVVFLVVGDVGDDGVHLFGVHFGCLCVSLAIL